MNEEIRAIEIRNMIVDKAIESSARSSEIVPSVIKDISPISSVENFSPKDLDIPESLYLNMIGENFFRFNTDIKDLNSSDHRFISVGSDIICSVEQKPYIFERDSEKTKG
ncbi:hypothetical protein GJ496_005975 [Pomphorhynchus laevis]|nr:hypothetical protein GJ496_005975 [Pomphorhynchus laevis]